MRIARRVAITVVFAVLLQAASALALTGSTTSLGQGTFGSIVTDDADQHVFVSSPGGNVVQVYNFSGTLVATIPNLSGAYGMVIHGSTLYVAESTAGTIEAINLATLADQGPLATGLQNPQWLAFAGGKLWTTEYRQSLASVSLSGTVTHFYTTAYHSPDLAASPATPSLLYVAEDGSTPGAIHELDVSSGSPVSTVQNTATDQGGIQQLAVSPDGTRVLPASATPSSIEELSASNLAPDGVVYPGSQSQSSVAVSPAEGGLVATGFAGGENIGVSELGNSSTLLTESTCGNLCSLGSGTYNVLPHGLALTADGTKMFAVSTQGIGNGLVLWTFWLSGSTSTTTTVQTSPSAPNAGQPVTITATVSPTPADGYVSFSSTGPGAISGCGSVPVSNGTATCTTSSLPTGSQYIDVQYGGDAVYSASSGQGTVFVNSTATSVNVTLNPTTLVADGKATTTATITYRDANGNIVRGDGIQFNTVPSTTLSMAGMGSNPDGSQYLSFAVATTPSTPSSLKLVFTDPGTVAGINTSVTLTLQRVSNFTWAGAATGLQWSTAANWLGNSAPSGTAGTLTFPDLTSAACSVPAPGAACYDATNDVSGISAAGLDIAGGDGYKVSGQGITLRGGGLTVSAPTGNGNPPQINLPLTLGVPQTWAIDAGPVVLGGNVSGNQPLTVNFNSGSLEPTTDMEVGALTGNYTGGFYLEGNASLNATDGNTVNLINGAGIEADQTGNTAGPVAVKPGGWISVGGVNPGGQLAVNGDLTFVNTVGSPGSTLSGGQDLDLAVNAPGTAAGSDYSQLTVTGNVSIGNTTLNVSQTADAAGNCDDLRPGDVLTLLSTSGGTITGTFANYANGATVDIVDSCNGADQDASGTLSYSSRAVTLTITAAGDAGDVPVELAPPSVAGTAQEGQTLQLDPGSWQGASILYYSWWQCRWNSCSQIPGAASSTFVPTSAQLGYDIVAGVTAVDAAGSNTDFTAATSAVIAEPVPAVSGPPTISGGTTVGDLLTAAPGTWSNSPTSYTYQWVRCLTDGSQCQTIPLASTGTYTLAQADVGHTLRIQVGAANYGGNGAAATSSPTAVIAAATSTTTTTTTATTPTTTRPNRPTVTVTTPTTTGTKPPTTNNVSAATVRSALNQILQPTGAAASAKQVLRAGGYKFNFSAPSGGQLTVSWTAVLNHRTVTLARANLSISAAHTVKLRIVLTAQGRRDLQRYRGLKIRAQVGFKAPAIAAVHESTSFRLAGPAMSPKMLVRLITLRHRGLRSKLGMPATAHR